MSSRKGFVQTVSGLVRPDELGPTMMHEHVLCDLTPPALAQRGGEDVEIMLKNIWEINYSWGLNHMGVARMTHRDVASRELELFRESGGGTVVELSNHGMKPDPLGLRDAAERSGVKVVMGCGQYVEVFLPPEIRDRSVEVMAADMIDAVEKGVGATDVRAGIIGEIGCSIPWTGSEQRAMRAAALAQQQTGAAITVHPGRTPDAIFAVIKSVHEAGGNVSRLIIDHIDRTIADIPTLLRLADTGCVIEYDLFGIETTFFPFSDFCLPNDGMRLDAIRELIRAGHLDRIVISQDICTLTRLVAFGGHGYGHIMRSVVPIMRRKGFSDDEIDALLVRNPARLLTFQ